MKKILLTQGKFAVVDDEDFEYLSQWKWWYDKSNGYACRTVWKGSKVYMHRAVTKFSEYLYTDHINHDKLDNRKSNLRLCTQSINMHNSIKRKDSVSKYKGVAWNKRNKKWIAQITINYKHINLGYFNNELDASQAYNSFKLANL